MLNGITYFCLVLMPILGCFFSRYFALSLSVLLIVHYLLYFFFANRQVRVDIILNVALALAVVTLPGSFIPFTLLWIYDKFLWCTEPFWQCVEVIGVVKLVMELSEMVREEIDNRPLVAKSSLLTWSAICYLVTAALLYGISGCSSFYVWCLIPLVLLLVACHWLTWRVEAGVLSDIATVTMISVAFLGDACCGLHSLTQTFHSPYEDSTLMDKSFFTLFVTSLSFPVAHGAFVWTFVRHLFSATFIVTACVRLAGLLCICHYVAQRLRGYEDDSVEEAEEEEEGGVYTSQLPVHAVMCIVYSQFLVHHLNRSFDSADGEATTVASLLGALFDVYHWGRVVQTFALIASYVYMLKHKAQDYCG